MWLRWDLNGMESESKRQQRILSVGNNNKGEHSIYDLSTCPTLSIVLTDIITVDYTTHTEQQDITRGWSVVQLLIC
jgi:hypothetical protein